MTIQDDVSLRTHSTMRLGGNAAHLAEIYSRDDLREAYEWAKANNQPMIMIGDGSNIVWRDEGYPGLVLVNKMSRYEVFGEDEVNVYITVGAGENWDSVVARTVDNHLTGIECLSLIPGTTGATPVQNVGAYGQDISQTLVSVEAFDTTTGEMATIANADCAFGYRTSRFKTTDRGRYFITAVTLHLTRGDPQPPFYAALTKYFEDKHITEYTPQVVRDAVIAIRNTKLPDPTQVANNGSFFANPIIDEVAFAQLQSSYPNVPHWPTDTPGNFKIPAAWLLEQAGYKDKHDPTTGMATWPPQPLVLINEKASSTAALLQFRDAIIEAVRYKFNIVLEQEPELLPAQSSTPQASPEQPPQPQAPRPDYLDMYSKL